MVAILNNTYSPAARRLFRLTWKLFLEIDVPVEFNLKKKIKGLCFPPRTFGGNRKKTFKETLSYGKWGS